MNIKKKALSEHKKKKGKLSIASKFPLKNRNDLSIAYTPGVAEPCKEIAKDKKKVYDYTIKGNAVAVITDGSAVLGLGNIGPEAAIPVMEGKAILFKEFANIDAFPICLATQDTEEIIKAVKLISPVFGGINLEDISSPRCVEIERRLQKELPIPVMHDDQHGTSVVVLAGLINALKVCKKKISHVKIIINGAGAAGLAIARMLYNYGAKDILVCDSIGLIYEGREGLNIPKQEIAIFTNKNKLSGNLGDALVNADVFIGVSVADALKPEWIKRMKKNPVIFAMANPVPEIMPNIAKKMGAKIVATGRSDFSNQLNNVLAFPGIFRGLLDARARDVTYKVLLAASKALANCVRPTAEKIIPSPFDKKVVKKVSAAVKNAAKK